MATNDRAMYELMYVVNTVLNDEQVKDIIDRVTAFIRENGGDIIEVDDRGSQRLAYPIEKKRNGHYALAYFRADGACLPGMRGGLCAAARHGNRLPRP